MKVLLLDTPLIIRLIPSVYPLLTDILTVSFRNENDDTTFSVLNTFTITTKHVEITLNSQPTDFEEPNKYEITVLNGENVIYIGKLIVLSNGTEAQRNQYRYRNNGFY